MSFPFGLHMSLQGSILLVGEGNFSFSASQSQQHNAAVKSSVTATCLQSEEEALRHEGAAENIQMINNSGTRLSSYWTFLICLQYILSTVKIDLIIGWIFKKKSYQNLIFKKKWLVHSFTSNCNVAPFISENQCVSGLGVLGTPKTMSYR